MTCTPYLGASDATRPEWTMVGPLDATQIATPDAAQDDDAFVGLLEIRELWRA
jgi:hypothetical protein